MAMRLPAMAWRFQGRAWVMRAPLQPSGRLASSSSHGAWTFEQLRRDEPQYSLRAFQHLEHEHEAAASRQTDVAEQGSDKNLWEGRAARLASLDKVLAGHEFHDVPAASTGKVKCSAKSSASPGHLERDRSSDPMAALDRALSELEFQDVAHGKEERRDFLPTEEWQRLPANAVCPPGLHFRVDMSSGQTFARIPPDSSKDASGQLVSQKVDS
mmetsp:Transcript_35449/g.77587  ORF Transcript_35449/g.77587 Transcript_35449/m.77587 type:complete len:213 (+) Transcript_35449:53-691(+)